MTFNQLYQLACENFLVNNEVMFKTLLTEFIDHKLIIKKDGEEVLDIPLDPEHLKNLIKEL